MLAVAGILAGVLLPAAAAHAAPTDGTVSVSPTRVIEAVPSGPHAIPITVTDDEPVPVDVALTASGLSQNADGSAAFTTPADPAPQIGTPRFVLSPGESRSVPVTFAVGPTTAGIYQAILATVTSTTSATSGAGSAPNIRVATRLAVLVELTGPAAASDSATISGISANGSAKSGHVTFSALVRNTGNTAISPVGTATLVKGGATLATVPLGTHPVVPGSAVTYSGAWNSPSSLNGRIAVHIHLDHPAADATGNITFQSGDAPKTAARIRSLHANSTSTGATITAQVTNTGNTEVPATLSAAVFTGKGYRQLGATHVEQLAAGHDVSLSQAVRLAPGKHELTVKILDGNTVLDQRQLTVTVKAPRPLLLIAIIAAGVLVIVLILIAWLLWRKASRRRH